MPRWRLRRRGPDDLKRDDLEAVSSLLRRFSFRLLDNRNSICARNPTVLPSAGAAVASILKALPKLSQFGNRVCAEGSPDEINDPHRST